MSNLEITVPTRFTVSEQRSDGAVRLQGLAAVYNQPSHDIGFREVLEPGAFRTALNKPGLDVVLNWNHDDTQPLARTGRNLVLRDTAEGLAFEAELPNTQLARDAVELVRTGVVSECSFRFSMDGGQDRWERRLGEHYRFISVVGGLHDICLATRPAYPATSASARGRQDAELAALTVRARATIARRGRLAVRARDPYGPGSEFSWFRDKARVAADEPRPIAIPADGTIDGRYAERFGSDWGAPALQTDGSIKDARTRLEIAAERALTTTLGAGGEFVHPGGGVPGFIAELFATSAKAIGQIADALDNQPLSAHGKAVETPILTGSASVAVHVDGASVSSTDPTTSKASDAVCMIAGNVDLARQDFDRSNLDEAIARELGELYASKLDDQLLEGSGATGQLLGLLTVTGTTATTYTDASPTAAKVLAQALGKCMSDTGTARGILPDLVILHARRYVWLATKLGFDPGQGLADIGLAARFVPSETVPLVSTTQDPIIVLRRQDIPLFRDPPVFTAMEEPASGNLQIRIQVRGFSGFLPDRFPKAIGIATGTGLTTPTF
jgi:HK97 family phage prohead protease